MSDIKLCKDCKHCKPKMEGVIFKQPVYDVFVKCARPTKEIDLVSGKPIEKTTYCDIERLYKKEELFPYDYCYQEAIFFEAKDV